jgi:hypothetical protein
MADNSKWLFVFIAIALVGFLLVTSPGWNQILGIEGQEIAALGVIILVIVVAGMYWVINAGKGK